MEDLVGRIQFLFQQYVPPTKELAIGRAVVVRNKIRSKEVKYNHDGVIITYRATLQSFQGDFDVLIHYFVKVDGKEIVNEVF